ncbi:hypothetical protein Tco_1144338 [Tanacetum coccineum]
MKGCEGDEIIMFEFVLRGFTESEIWDKIKEPLSPKLNEDEYSICCENTTHMMNALKEARIESREMLLSIHHSLKMLLDIISKMNRKLEDERIKKDGKGKEKIPNSKITHLGLAYVYVLLLVLFCVYLLLVVAKKTFEGEKESEALKLMKSGKASLYGSKRAIAYMELCKTHKENTMFKLHQITRPRSRRELHQWRSSSSLRL